MPPAPIKGTCADSHRRQDEHGSTSKCFLFSNTRKEDKAWDYRETLELQFFESKSLINPPLFISVFIRELVLDTGKEGLVKHRPASRELRL